MQIRYPITLMWLLPVWFGSLSLAAVPNVVVTIKPVHSLVAGVMQGLEEPGLLLESGVSPHHYALRPSDVRQLESAAVVFMVGDTLESFLVRALGSIATEARVVKLIDAPGVVHTPLAAVDDQRHERRAGPDPHIWLSPANARSIIGTAVRVLSIEDPANRNRYERNGELLLERLDTLDAELHSKLQPAVGVPYVVFHDAYRGFEHYYGLANAGVVTIHPERLPGARKLAEIRRVAGERNVHCIFSEPQFDSALVARLIEDTDLKTATLDPLGVDIPAGADAYFLLLTRLAGSFADCLAD